MHLCIRCRPNSVVQVCKQLPSASSSPITILGPPVRTGVRTQGTQLCSPGCGHHPSRQGQTPTLSCFSVFLLQGFNLGFHGGAGGGGHIRPVSCRTTVWPRTCAPAAPVQPAVACRGCGGTLTQQFWLSGEVAADGMGGEHWAGEMSSAVDQDSRRRAPQEEAG